MIPLNDTTNLLAQSVRAHRESRGLSLGGLAEKAGISKASLSKIEAGQGNPSLEVLRRIADALNVPTGALFAGENRPQLHVIRSGEGQIVTSDSGLSIRHLLVEGRNHRTTIEELHLPAQTTYRSSAHLPGTLEFPALSHGRSPPGASWSGSAAATRRCRVVLCRSPPHL